MKTVDLEILSQQWSPVSELLRPLNNEWDYENKRALLDQLIDAVGTGENHPLATLMYHVGNLIDEFEKANETLNSIGTKGDVISTIKFLMDQHGLKRADLSDVFGSQRNVSEVLRGVRDVNLKHIKKLAAKFNVEPSVFID